MKKLFISFILMLFCSFIHINAQEHIKRIGIHSSFGSNELIRFRSLDGGGIYHGDGFFTIGLNYQYSINSWLDLETGLEYSKQNFLYYSPHRGDIHLTVVQFSKMNIGLLSVPFTVKANFFKYFFANGGLLLDIDIYRNLNRQSGIGTMLGIGAKYDFDFRLSIYLNPYAKIHALLPFAPEKYHRRIIEGGLRLGVAYKIGK